MRENKKHLVVGSLPLKAIKYWFFTGNWALVRKPGSPPAETNAKTGKIK
jgi:hypothetical protein